MNREKNTQYSVKVERSGHEENQRDGFAGGAPKRQTIRELEGHGNGDAVSWQFHTQCVSCESTRRTVETHNRDRENGSGNHRLLLRVKSRESIRGEAAKRGHRIPEKRRTMTLPLLPMMTRKQHILMHERERPKEPRAVHQTSRMKHQQTASAGDEKTLR